MSTRSTTHFTYGNGNAPTAIIYRHGDGYPDGAGVDILRFLDECAKLKDNRFRDPSYLAAKYVVFLADMFNYDWDDSLNKIKPKSRLEFISVGVTQQDTADIEYRYVIDCENLTPEGRPTVKCFEVSDSWDSEKRQDRPVSDWTLTEVEIPQPEAA